MIDGKRIAEIARRISVERDSANAGRNPSGLIEVLIYEAIAEVFEEAWQQQPTRDSDAKDSSNG